MAELAKPTIRGLARSGLWGVDNAEQVVEFSADAVDEFIDQLPEGMREFAIEALAERLKLCREQLEAAQTAETVEV